MLEEIPIECYVTREGNLVKFVRYEKLLELQTRINKAIEYIEKNCYTTFETIDDINYFIVRLDKCEDLLDILKGVDK